MDSFSHITRKMSYNKCNAFGSLAWAEQDTFSTCRRGNFLLPQLKGCVGRVRRHRWGTMGGFTDFQSEMISYFGDFGRKKVKNSLSSWYQCGLWAGGVWIIWELVRSALPRSGLHLGTATAESAFERDSLFPLRVRCFWIFMKHCLRPPVFNWTLHENHLGA